MSRPMKPSAIGRRTLLGAAGGLALAAPSIVRAQSAGVALLIGNSKYQWEAQLPNVRRDVPDIAKRFQAMGLKTEVLQDVGRDAFKAAVDKFGEASKGASMSAFYFAGHGATWNRMTYLVPTDADLSNPNTVETLMPGPKVIGAMGGASNRFMVLDACRNNPADGWRQLASERAAVVNENRTGNAPPPNSLVLFSTAPGRVALDGPAGQNSPFAACLMRQLDAPSVEFSTLAGRLRRDLLIATEGKQVLWDRNSYQGSFALKGARLPDAANRSGWANDPSKIIDLTNAYAFARQSKFSIPEGLIAHRPAGASTYGQMVGSFKFTGRNKGGIVAPALIIVMSVEEGQTAELITGGTSEIGPYWRFVTGKLSGGRLEFVPRDGAAKHIFTWKDAGGGSMTQLNEGVGGQDNRPYSTNFTRLDG